MEDNAAAHHSDYTTKLRDAEGIPKVDWPPNSPHFNPIERIWMIMKSRILRQHGAECITTAKEMKEVLKEECDKITIEEINREIEKLPAIMARCIQVRDGNNFHA